MSKLVLIDGNAILHRAFHALPPLTNKDGQLTNAVYGFFSMFLKIVEDLRPDCVIVCFDRPKPTFRKELFKDYQAHRPKMDDGLVPQIGIVHELLEKAKVKIFEMDGYEADDLIGTLATQAARINTNTTNFKYQINTNEETKEKEKIESFEIRNLKLEIIIVSGDRDLLQLVNSHVMMLAPISGITKMILYDETEVEKKYGIKPGQMIDYKALIGDASDNYPGVAGVGPKTGAELLKEFGSLENIYKNLDHIKNEGLKTKLKAGEESAEMAKKLATIVIDVPVELNLNECSASSFDIEGLKEEFEKLGFKSLINRLQAKIPEKNSQAQEKNKEEKKKEGEQLGLL